MSTKLDVIDYRPERALRLLSFPAFRVEDNEKEKHSIKFLLEHRVDDFIFFCKKETQK